MVKLKAFLAMLVILAISATPAIAAEQFNPQGSRVGGGPLEDGTGGTGGNRGVFTSQGGIGYGEGEGGFGGRCVFNPSTGVDDCVGSIPR